MSLSEAKNNTEKDINLIPLSEASKKSGYTPEYLNSLSRKGILEAQKIGRNWYTTEEWLNSFLATVSEKKNNGVENGVKTDDQAEVLEKQNIPTESAFVMPVEAEEITAVESQSQEQEYLPEMKSRKAHWFQALAGLSSMAIVVPMIFLVMYSAKYYTTQKKWAAEKLAMINISPQGVIFNENGVGEEESLSEQKINGVVSGEETDATDEAAKRAGILLASENYKASQLTVGGVIAVANAEENSPLEISDVKSESFITNSKNNQGSSKEEVKLVVSWKTNKLAMSQLSYSKNNGQDMKTIKEQSFGFNHSVIITQITPRTSYVYQIKARDHWGTEIDSDFYGIFTTSKPVSVFDLISEQINQIFGWAVKN